MKAGGSKSLPRKENLVMASPEFGALRPVDEHLTSDSLAEDQVRDAAIAVVELLTEKAPSLLNRHEVLALVEHLGMEPPALGNRPVGEQKPVEEQPGRWVVNCLAIRSGTHSPNFAVQTHQPFRELCRLVRLEPHPNDLASCQAVRDEHVAVLKLVGELNRAEAALSDARMDQLILWGRCRQTHERGAIYRRWLSSEGKRWGWRLNMGQGQQHSLGNNCPKPILDEEAVAFLTELGSPW